MQGIIGVTLFYLDFWLWKENRDKKHEQDESER